MSILDDAAVALSVGKAVLANNVLIPAGTALVQAYTYIYYGVRAIADGLVDWVLTSALPYVLEWFDWLLTTVLKWFGIDWPDTQTLLAHPLFVTLLDILHLLDRFFPVKLFLAANAGLLGAWAGAYAFRVINRLYHEFPGIFGFKGGGL